MFDPGQLYFLVVGVIFLMIVGSVIGLISRFIEKKRVLKLEDTSKDIGFSYSKSEDETIPNNNHYPHLFSQGHAQKAWNIMENETENGDLIKIFDYEYTEGGGKNRRTYDQTICLFSSLQIDLPAFHLRPENIFNRFLSDMGLAGYEDIDFESNPDFSDHYLLTGELDAEQPRHDNEGKVRNIFNENVLDFYEKNVGLCTEAMGNTLIYYRHNKRVSPENIEGFLKEGIKVLSLFTTSQSAKGEPPQAHSQIEPPEHNQNQLGESDEVLYPESPMPWYIRNYIDVLKRYVLFDGRASKREFWWFTLINSIISFCVLPAITAILGVFIGFKPSLAQIYNLAVFLPSLAVGIRRMKDTGRSGWWVCVPIINIMFWVSASEPRDNQYGPPPLAPK
ncbi:MAG: DUF805 domain-containing protein [Candidatus Poribacteria bacterium]|jgi:uncharacterized membrane protein YhaH (DUF805 family)|nr:DUF805 domain-containing protein [Candidatus Poribacteria bacterium]MDP6999940.1 DUF805 domain-containing protein [Candidatus Poribacteria bacterium]